MAVCYYSESYVDNEIRRLYENYKPNKEIPKHISVG